SQGKEHTLTQYFVKTGDNTWNAHYFVDGTDTTIVQALEFSPSGQMEVPYDAATGVNNPVAINFALPTGGVDPLAISLNYGGEGIGGSTQFGSDFIVNRNDPTGYAAGEQNGIAVEKDGMVYATYSNGERMLQ